MSNDATLAKPVELTDAELDYVAGGAPPDGAGLGIGTGDPDFTHANFGFITAGAAGGFQGANSAPGRGIFSAPGQNR